MNDLTSEFLRSSDLNNDLPASIKVPSVVAYDAQIPMPTVASSTKMPSTTHVTSYTQQSSASPFETSRYYCKLTCNINAVCMHVFNTCTYREYHFGT